jgi:hypothetical protein
LLRKLNFRYKAGTRYVGGFLGSDEARGEWLDPQIEQWVHGIKQLAKVARKYPQTAYAGLASSLHGEWQYLMRVTKCDDEAYSPIEKAIVEEFLPALFGLPQEEIASMRSLFALSVKRAGLGLANPSQSAERCHATSKA